MRYLPLLLALSACTTTQEEVAPIDVVDPGVERMPSLQFQPNAWQTTGSSLQAALQLDPSSPAGDELDLKFRYTGPGNIELPQALTSTEFSEPVMVEFRSEPGQQGEGLIEVLYTSQTKGEVVVATLPVLHTTKLVEAIDFAPLDPSHFDARYESVFAVVVHFVPPTGAHAEAMRAARQAHFHASVEAQIGFAPEVEVDFNVPSQMLPKGSRSTDSLAALVKVARRSTAPMRRPFAKVEVQVAGDRAVEYLPLEF